MKTLIKLISSGLYFGYSPIASGTVGSFLGLLIYLHLQDEPLIYSRRDILFAEDLSCVRPIEMKDILKRW